MKTFEYEIEPQTSIQAFKARPIKLKTLKFNHFVRNW